LKNDFEKRPVEKTIVDILSYDFLRPNERSLQKFLKQEVLFHKVCEKPRILLFEKNQY